MKKLIIAISLIVAAFSLSSCAHQCKTPCVETGKQPCQNHHDLKGELSQS